MAPRLTFTADRILVDGRPDLVFGGEFQYFRVRRDLWDKGLVSLKEAGINAISTYIPWVWHEVRENDYDFDGRTAPERDLRGFLYLCRRLELSLVVKPGPYIYAEYQGFGIPLWLRNHYPDTQMVIRQAPAFREIAVNHPKYLDLVRRWFAALAPMLKPLVDSGEISALQLDNETGMPQYGSGPYLSDHNPETIRQLREWLQSRHGGIAELNRAWNTQHPTFDAIRPPDKPTNRAQLMDLAIFVEDYLVSYLATLKQVWRDLGIDTHFFLNDIWMPAWPNHWLKKNRVAPVGFDMYPKFIRVKTPLDQPFAISYVPKMFDAVREGGPLMGPEIGCGWLDTQVSVPEIATWQKMMASYLRGTQANFLYTVHDGVDPDDSRYPFQSAFDHEGNHTSRMDVVKTIGKFMAGWGPLLAGSTAIESPIAILHYQDATREVLEYTVDPIRTARESLDSAIDRSVTIFSASSGVFGALAESGFDPAVIELRRTSLAEMQRYAVCFFASSGPLPEELRLKFEAYVEAGGRLVVTGGTFESPGGKLLTGPVKRTWRPRALSVVAGAFLDLAFFSLREAAKITHPLVRFTVEKLQPVMGLIKFATRAGVWISSTSSGQRVWASRFVSYCQVPPNGEELLNFMGATVGYLNPLGTGAVAFIGTLLGTHLDSPGYYLDDPARGRSISAFLVDLLKGWGVTPQVKGGDGLEVILRRTGEGCLVGIVNRRGDRDFDIEIVGISPEDVLEKQFCYRGSKASWNGRLSGNLTEGDILLAHLVPRRGSGPLGS